MITYGDSKQGPDIDWGGKAAILSCPKKQRSLRMPNVAVVGSASWGTCLGMVLARKGVHVKLWTRTEEEAKRFNKERENSKFLPGYRFPRRMAATGSMDEALDGADAVVMAVPAQTMRQNARMLKEHLRSSTFGVNAAKGLELGTGKRMSQVIEEELNGTLGSPVCVVSGPDIAQEAAQGVHSVAVVASRDMRVAEKVQHLLMTKSFCLYTSSDIVGVELGGTLKNIVAMGTGIADGLGYGENAKAAFITRALTEVTALGVAMRADPLTFAGLAGLGDMIATCFSPYSRNRHVGRELATGHSLKEITASMPHVAEGITTCQATVNLAGGMGVDMPVTGALYKVLYEGVAPKQAVAHLIKPPAKPELAMIKEAPRCVAYPAQKRWQKLPLGLLSQPV